MANEKTVIFKKISLQDLTELQKIEHQVQPNPWSEKSMTNTIEHPLCHCIKLCSAATDELLGYAFLLINGDDAELLNFAIAPQHQTQGWGEKLLRWLLSLSEENQVKQLFLEVRAGNLTAIKLYQKVGFQNLATRKDYYRYGSICEDAVIMRFNF